MASQGPNSPGTGANDASIGTAAWVASPGTLSSSIATSDNVYATTGGPSSQTSEYLKATNFGFSIPSGATINGILVEIEKGQTGAGAGFIVDNSVRIVKSDGSIGSTNKADTSTHWVNVVSETYIAYGGSADLWGETWTASDINSTNFGAAISASSTYSGGPAVTMAVDHIRITVFYTTGGGNSPTGVNDMLSFFL